MRRRTGFTILELLVVIAILAVLMGLLFPVIRRVRDLSLNTLCVNRLRDLSQASTWALQQNGSFPLPSTAHGAGLLPGLPTNVPVPHQIETRLLNELASPLAFAPLTGGVPIERLPPRVQCPFVEPNAGRGPVAFAGSEYYYTGYIYCVGLGVVQPKPVVLNAAFVPTAAPAAVVLKDRRSPSVWGDAQGVLWADDVHWSSTGQWQFAHVDAAAAASSAASMPLTFNAPSALKGQHRAYIDGSVQWVPAAAMGLDVSSQSSRDAAATFKIGPNLYWWF
jgi:prepilin-type N-terminal cleavage/methylation domain-containing protein